MHHELRRQKYKLKTFDTLVAVIQYKLPHTIDCAMEIMLFILKIPLQYKCEVVNIEMISK